MTNDEILSQSFKTIKKLNSTRDRTLVLKKFEKADKESRFYNQKSI